MSEDKVPSGDALGSSAAEKKDSVSYETYQRVLAQRKSDQAELERIKKEYQSILDVKKQEEEHKLNEAGEYKKLIELRDQKIKEIADEKESWAKKFSESENRMQSIKKYAAFNSKLPAPLAHEDYYSLIDFNQIVCDPETGDVDQDSVEKLVNNFVKVHGNRVLKTGTTKMPNEASTTSTKIDYNDWLKMPVKEQLKVKWVDLKNVP
jgi:hypothetical protein